VTFLIVQEESPAHMSVCGSDNSSGYQGTGGEETKEENNGEKRKDKIKAWNS